jgi:hypothetical protein
MPLPVAHGLVGASIVAGVHPTAVSNRRWTPLLWGAFLAICPDFDFFFEWILHWPDVHRTFTHSLIVAIGIGVLSVPILGKAHRREALAYSLAFLSHTLLDFATTKTTEGVSLLWPFSDEPFKLGFWGGLEFTRGITGLDVLVQSVPDMLVTGLLELFLFAPLFLLVFLVQQRKARAYRATQTVMQEQGV